MHRCDAVELAYRIRDGWPDGPSIDEWVPALMMFDLDVADEALSMVAGLEVSVESFVDAARSVVTGRRVASLDRARELVAAGIAAGRRDRGAA